MLLYTAGYGIMGAVIKACGGCGGGEQNKNGKTFRPIVISGASGSGKSSLVKRLLTEHKDYFTFCISHTTRAQRPGEKNGQDYHFVSMEKMMKMIEGDEFIEHAKFANNLYGTSKKALEDVMKSGRICVMDMDLNGVKSMKRTDFKALYICIKAPSIEILEERLRQRGTESAEVIAQRILNGIADMEYADIRGSYDHIIVNDNLDTAYEELEKALEQDIERIEEWSHKKRKSSS